MTSAARPVTLAVLSDCTASVWAVVAMKPSMCEAKSLCTQTRACQDLSLRCGNVSS